jgi:hypothetical protein
VIRFHAVRDRFPEQDIRNLVGTSLPAIQVEYAIAGTRFCGSPYPARTKFRTVFWSGAIFADFSKEPLFGR